MLSVVIQALKKLVMFLCTPFASRCLIYSDWALEITLHSSSARQIIHPVQFHLIGIRATSSPGRFSLALEVGRPTSKAREKRPGDEVGIRVGT